MAGNKFAAMLHRNAICWIEIVLIYTFLEWILIGLLFANAFFCYLISWYVSYFGLKSSCPLCTRIDRSSTSDPLIDIVCNKHVSEIGRLTSRESEEDEQQQDDSDFRGVANPDDTRHLYKTGSCKRVHGSNNLYKIINDDIESMHVVSSQVRDSKIQMNREELFQFFSHIENVQQDSRAGGGVALRVELADRMSYPPSVKSKDVGNFVVSTVARNIHEEEERTIDDDCSKSNKISRLEEEKTVMQMDASHYRRMMEEKSRHNKKEKINLSKQLEDCRSQIVVLQNKLNGRNL